MASVTSLDQDMRNLRLSRYTPQAANEARQWIESTLGESLPPGDLLEALKDGVALCKLVNLAVQGQAGAIKYKNSAMPFVQMENISHFLRACEMAPLNMPSHDRFLTVDLYEAKDPLQVLQTIGALSRQANKINPSRFPTTIGAKKSAAAMSPATTGNGFRRPASPTKPLSNYPSSNRAMSPSLTGGSTGSQQSAGGTKSPTGPVSSWSKRSDEGSTAPAWNIHQYGYMGGASQGNQGISFGARRQITSQAPGVPSLAEKQKARKEKEEAEERQRLLAQEERERRAQKVQEAEEKARLEEERQWEEETKRHREEERQRLEQQKREWEQQERRWQEEEEVRKREDAVLQSKMSVKRPPEKPRVPSSGILRGQTLAQYQKEQAASTNSVAESTETPEQRRVRELEKQLEEARERERQYQAEREERLKKDSTGERSRPSTSETARPGSAQQSDVSWVGDEREFQRKHYQTGNDGAPSRPTQPATSRPLPTPSEPQEEAPTRPLPAPASIEAEPVRSQPALPARGQPSPFTRSPFNRPLPAPAKSFEPEPFEPEQRQPNRTDAFLSANEAPSTPEPRISAAQEAGDTSLEQQRLRDSRVASQQKTKAGGWASKSLLEREMERERERQREWEAAQEVSKSAPRDTTQGSGPAQTWDVHQYGYMGGDSQNKGSGVGSGINMGGRRPIGGKYPTGPRPMK
ncbi:Putative smooth muscle protein/calponin [Septoria linicola]|uniref:Smooth muscle protein/calponin n=1 Tax=Septoria linicola TaxID=215465 RepID=A0A9Q9ALF3_9PEZI|nr:putative smooth muscle protein/calponin [Septoria linicola]USW49133.1 Putative smooth muscle protein/calponin [Septoria linicola]